MPEQKYNNTGAKCTLTMAGGRQRHNASTHESKRTTAPTSRKKLYQCVVLLRVQVLTAAAVL